MLHPIPVVYKSGIVAVSPTNFSSKKNEAHDHKEAFLRDVADLVTLEDAGSDPDAHSPPSKGAFPHGI